MPDEVIAEVRSPAGRRVLIHARRWRHVLEVHADMLGYLQGAVKTIESPDYVEPDRMPGRERYFRQGGPQEWMRVVIEFAGDCDRLVTAFPQMNDPRSPLR